MATKEREVIITFSNKPIPDDFPVHFVEFMQEMRRVIDARKERESIANKEAI